MAYKDTPPPLTRPLALLSCAGPRLELARTVRLSLCPQCSTPRLCSLDCQHSSSSPPCLALARAHAQPPCHARATQRQPCARSTWRPQHRRQRASRSCHCLPASSGTPPAAAASTPDLRPCHPSTTRRHDGSRRARQALDGGRQRQRRSSRASPPPSRLPPMAPWGSPTTSWTVLPLPTSRARVNHDRRDVLAGATRAEKLKHDECDAICAATGSRLPLLSRSRRRAGTGPLPRRGTRRCTATVCGVLALGQATARLGSAGGRARGQAQQGHLVCASPGHDCQSDYTCP